MILQPALHHQNQLRGVKQWWDDEGWFGKQDAKVRREVREACSDLLQPHLALCKCPLMLLTLELMFCTRAGCGKVIECGRAYSCFLLIYFYLSCNTNNKTYHTVLFF